MAYTDDSKWEVMWSGRGGGRTYAAAQYIKTRKLKSVLVFSRHQMDSLISMGVKPSQLIMEGEVQADAAQISRLYIDKEG